MNTALIVLAVVAAAVAVPVVKRDNLSEGDNCATRCSGIHNKYKYVVGKSYEYSLTSATTVEIASHSRHNTNITQEGKLWISVHGPCEFEMNIESITASANVPAHYSREMTARPVRFAFDDGRIEHICVDEAESTWVLNVKRGILSAIQNAWEADELAVHEEEIGGTCQSTYGSSRHGEETHYSRRKHSHSCRGHHNMHGAMRATQYDLDSELSSTSDMGRAHHECTHQVTKAGILKRAACKETQSFTPFEQDDGGVIKSTTSTIIKLERTVKDAGARRALGSRKSIHYDASEMDYEVSAGSKTEAVNSLKQLCETSDLYVVKETPALFVTLVRSLRRMSEKDITTLVKSSETGECDKQSKFILDALPMCGSEQCVQAMVNVLKSNKLSPTAKQSYFTSLAFVPKASLKMIESLVSIVDQQPNHVRGLLGVSSLVHTYCEQNVECENEKAVKDILKRLTAKLGDKCTTDGSGEELEHMVIVLKALGNIGHIHKAVGTVLECAQTRANPVEVRVAAVQSLRRLPCEHKERKALTTLFQNQQEDVELRIFSFLTLVKCPSHELVVMLNDQLENEEINQVGSFVWSYMKSRRSSTDPTQRIMRDMLREQGVSRRFERDPRQYSRFYETGSFSKAANSGAHMEEGVIFVPGSFTPRAVYANMSMHLFGHSVNFFEFGARAEGLDHLYEGLAGPDGMLERPSADFGKDEDSSEYAKLSIDFEKRPHYEARDRLALSAYVRIFGDEIAYTGIDDPRIMETIQKKTDFKIISDLLAKQQTLSLAKNIMFIDLTKALPTSGLPLRLQITGVAALNIEASGKMDVTKTFKKPHSMEIRSSIKPSAAIEIATTLSINVGGVQSGLRLVSRMHTATAINHEVTLEKGEIITFKVGVPQDSMKIVDFEIDALALVQSTEVAIADATEFKESKVCTPAKWNTIVGMETCWGYRRPIDSAHQFPKRFWIEMEKTDESLETYELVVKMQKTPMPYPKYISINTPGSKVDREIVFEVKPTNAKTTVDVKYPGHSLSLELPKGESVDRHTYKQKVIMTIDDEETYEFDGKLHRSITDGMSRTALKAVAKRPDGEDILLDTHIALKGLAKMDAKFEVKGLNEQKTLLTGLIVMPSSSNMDTIVKFTHECPKYKALLDVEGKSASKDNYKMKFATELSSQTDEFESLNARFNVEKKMVQGREHLNFDLVKSVHPESNFELEVKKDAKKIEANLKYGDQLTGEASFEMERTRKGKKETIKSSLVIPAIAIEHKLEGLYENNLPHKLHAQATISSQSGTDKLELEAFFNRKQSPYMLDARVSAKRTGGMDYLIKKSIKEIADDKYTSKTIVQWAAGRQMVVDAKMTTEMTGPYSFNYVVDADAKISGIKEGIKLHKTVKMTPQTYQLAAILKRGSHAVYDVNVELNEVAPTKKTIKSHLKSHYVGELDVTGEVDYRQHITKLNVKRNGKQFGKWESKTDGSIYQRGQPVDLKMAVEWSMDTPKPSALSLEYLLGHKDAHTREHTIKALTKLNGGKAYKVESQIRKNGIYTMNSTMEIDNKRAVELSWGSRPGKTGLLNHQIDFTFKTMAPFARQHKTGLFLVLFKQHKYHAHGDVTCHVSKDKALVEFDYGKAGELVENNVRIELGDNIKFAQTFKLNMKTMKSEKTQLIQWMADKKIVSSGKSVFRPQSGEFEVEESVTMPFEMLSQYNYKLTRKNHPKKQDYTVYFKLNNVERLNGVVSRLGNERQSATGYTLKLKTNKPQIGEIVGKIDMTPTTSEHIELENVLLELTWGEGRKLHLHRANGCDLDGTKCKYNAKWEANLGRDKQMKARATYTQDRSEHVVELEMKKNKETYMLNTEFDSQSLDGKVKIVTPFSELKTASIKLSKKADGEYVISTRRNGADGAQVEGTIKRTEKGYKTYLTVDNIDVPVKLETEFDTRVNNKHVKLIVTSNYDGAEATPYGVELLKQEKRIALTIVTPLRQPHLEVKRVNSGTYEVAAQLDRNGREPTTLLVKKTPFEVLFTDPALKHPIKLVAHDSHKAYVVSLQYTDKDADKLTVSIGSSIKADETKEMLIEIKHPASKLHQRYFYTYKRVAGVQEAAFGIDIKRGTTTLKYGMETTVDERKQYPAFKVSSPRGDYTFKFEKENGENRLLVLSDKDEQPSYVIVWYSKGKGHNMIEIRRGSNEHVIAHVSDKLLDKNTFVSKAYHVDGNTKHDDYYVKVSLEKKSLLKIRVHVSPSSWKNLVQSMVIPTTVDDEESEGLLEAISVSTIEGARNVEKALKKAVKPMAVAWKKERDELVSDAGTQFGDMFEIVADYYEMVHEFVMLNMDVVQMSVEEYTRNMGVYSFNPRQILIAIGQAIRDAVNVVVEPIVDAYRGMCESAQNMVEDIQSNTESITGSETYQKVARALGKITRTIKSFSSYKELKASVNAWLDTIEADISDYRSTIDKLMEYSFVRGIAMAIQPAMDHAMSYDLREMINSVIDYVQEVVSTQDVRDYLPRVNVYLPKKGQFEVQFPLPIKADGLEDLVSKMEPSAVRQYVSRVQQRLTSIISNDGEISDELWEREGATKPQYLDMEEEGFAHYSIGYVMGDRHIVTFDGTVVSLTSKCEYLLAQDFLTNKFTLSAKFDKVDGKTEVKSLKAKLRGETIVISREGIVTVNKQKVELPYQKLDEFEGEAIVTMVRLDHGVLLTTFDGVKIEYDFYHRQAMIRLPGRYHGHSNGLLGSNDNEAANDLHLADGKSNADVAKFADQWVIGKACKATEAKPNATPAQKNKCDQLFRSRSSSLNTCFRRVAPRAYHTMCQYDRCNATSAYVRACEQSGLVVELPNECVKCESTGSEMSQGEEKTVQTNGGSEQADIVFVVEERPCMQFVKEKIVSKMADKIVAKLGKMKSSVRYGVIGFGGEEVHNAPHFHTGGYSINFDEGGLRSAVQSLDFTNEYTTSAWQDPLAAIDFTSARYPFRPTAAKTIVLLTCSECGSQVDYYEVQQRLLELNLQLHVYTTSDVIVDDDTVEAIGFSASELFTTNKGVSKELRASLSSPHDTCTVLAQEMNGTVWSLSNGASSEFAKPAQYIAAAVVEQAKLNECLICECLAFQLAPRTTCQPCQVLTPTSMTSSSFFNNPLIALRSLGKKMSNSVTSDTAAWML